MNKTSTSSSKTRHKPDFVPKTSYNPGNSFALQVFWILSNKEAAQNLLTNLDICARETTKTSPCTCFYIFNKSPGHSKTIISDNLKISTVSMHPHYAKYFRHLKMGTKSKEILQSRLAQDGFLPEILDLDPDSPIPESISLDSAVLFECTEFYLDDVAFFDHSKSKKFLDAYCKVINPKNSIKPFTYYFGNPTDLIVDSILDPMFHAEKITPLASSLFNHKNSVENPPKPHLVLKIDITTLPLENQSSSKNADNFEIVITHLFKNILQLCSSSLLFQHPLLQDTYRLTCSISIPNIHVSLNSTFPQQFQECEIVSKCIGDAFLLMPIAAPPSDPDSFQSDITSFLSIFQKSKSKSTGVPLDSDSLFKTKIHYPIGHHSDSPHMCSGFGQPFSIIHQADTDSTSTSSSGFK